MNKRKLVRIEKIDRLDPIPKADRIEVATILGWNVIVKKGEFKVNDNCVFFEIDSFLPDEDRYNFLGAPKTHQGKQGYRLKTIKLKGQISQGLALPLHMFKDKFDGVMNLYSSDLSNTLNVFKYDVALTSGSKSMNPKTGQPAGKYPSFLRKTDQERIQNLTNYFNIHEDSLFEETLKLDGSSLTAYHTQIQLPWYKRWYNILNQNASFLPSFSDTKFGVCSRNVDLKPSANYTATFENDGKTSTYSQSSFWDIMLKHNMPKHLPIGYAIQGELCGPSIQSNHEKLDSNEFFLFDVFDIAERRYLTSEARREWCNLYMPKSLQYVPTVSKSIAIFKDRTLECLLERADSKSLNEDTISEGRVYKHLTNPDITFKCINNRYLLKSEQ